MIRWKKRNTVNTSYVSADGKWQIRRQGRKPGSRWSLMRADYDGDPYLVVGAFNTLFDAQASAEYQDHKQAAEQAMAQLNAELAANKGAINEALKGD